MDGVHPQEAQLRQEVAGLADDDILALCYAFKNKTARLRLYLDVLRRRGGERAQFASCLICFDLARQGDASFQREFVYLADTVRGLALKNELIHNLIGSDHYLGFIWDLCQAALREMDPRMDAEFMAAEADEIDVGAIALISDNDFKDLDVPAMSADDVTYWRRFDDAVEHFLGGVVGVPVYDADSGFRLQSKRDVARVERFLLELESLRGLVAPARGFRALLLLFYGAQMRSKGVFGGVNERKQDMLRAGLKEFTDSGNEIFEVVGVMSPLHAGEGAWEKICEVLVDYTHWLHTEPDEARGGVKNYDPVGRLLSRGTRKLDRWG